MADFVGASSGSCGFSQTKRGCSNVAFSIVDVLAQQGELWSAESQVQTEEETELFVMADKS